MSNITADSAQEQSAVKNDKKIVIKSVLEEAREPFFMFLYFFFTLSYLEILIHLCVYGNTTAMRIYPIVFSLPVAMLLSALASLGRGRARKIICILAVRFLSRSRLIFPAISSPLNTTLPPVTGTS